MGSRRAGHDWTTEQQHTIHTQQTLNDKKENNSVFLIDKLKILLQRRYTNGQQTYEKMLTSLIFRKMQIKMTVRHHFTSKRLVIKRLKQVLVRTWGKLDPIDIAGLPCGSDGKESACDTGDLVRSLAQEDPQEKGMETQGFLPGESHGQKSLVGYSPEGHRVTHN